jgi:hypothetical protein
MKRYSNRRAGPKVGEFSNYMMDNAQCPGNQSLYCGN